MVSVGRHVRGEVVTGGGLTRTFGSTVSARNAEIGAYRNLVILLIYKATRIERMPGILRG